MAEPKRVQPRDVWSRIQSGSDLLLVCAYDDEAKCRANQLRGAITLNEFRSRRSALPKDREVVFYCG